MCLAFTIGLSEYHMQLYHFCMCVCPNPWLDYYPYHCLYLCLCIHLHPHPLQNSLTAVETVKVEQSIAEEERLLYEQSDLRIEVVELTRLAAIKV